MNVTYSKAFEKAVRHLSGKQLESIRQVILEVKRAENVFQITDCKKLQDYDNVYRIRIGSLRAFFLLRINLSEGTVFFQYLIPRGQAYDKKIMDNLKNIDNI